MVLYYIYITALYKNSLETKLNVSYTRLLLYSILAIKITLGLLFKIHIVIILGRGVLCLYILHSKLVNHKRQK